MFYVLCVMCYVLCVMRCRSSTSFQARLSREGHTAIMHLLESVPEHNFWTVQCV